MSDRQVQVHSVVCWSGGEVVSRPQDVITLGHVMQYAEDHPSWVVECTLESGNHHRFTYLNEEGDLVFSKNNPFQRD